MEWRWYIIGYIELRPLWWQVIVWEPPIVEKMYDRILLYGEALATATADIPGQKFLTRNVNVLQAKQVFPAAQ